MATPARDIPKSNAVLLVTDQYATSKEDDVSTTNQEVVQILTGAGRKVYSLVLEDTEEDRKCAEVDGVELILPTSIEGDTRKPCLDWLTFDHLNRYPRLPQDIGWIVGHADVTSRAAATIKEKRFPLADISMVTQTIPEDTEKYKEEEKAMGIGKKEDSIRQDAEKAKTVFSVGHRIHDHFTNTIRAIPKDNRPVHKLFLPEPSKIFQETTVEYVESREKVVLLISRVNEVGKLKGLDFAAKSLARVAKRSHERIQLRICGVSEEQYRTSMNILQTSINSGKLIPTLLPHGTQEDICRHMQQAHLVLMPSRTEPFGLVGLEAMAAGVPVLISDQSGLATLVYEVIPEFHHSVLAITGDDSIDITQWADQIEKALRMSKVAFNRAAELKQRLLESRYWEESHQCFLQACGGPGTDAHQPAAQVQKRKRDTDDTEETNEDRKALTFVTGDEDSPGTISQDKRTVPQDEETESAETVVLGRQLELQSSAKPTRFQFYYIKDNAGMKWKDLARMLGFSEADIERFEYKHRDPRESCMDMLTTWKGQIGDERTTCILKEALEDAGLKDIADDLDLYENSYPRLTASDNELITQQEKHDKTASESQKAGIDNLTGENLHKVVQRMVQEYLQANPEESGDVNYAADGEDKGLFFSGVDVSKPLWAVVDIHGSAVAVQFVGEQAVCKAAAHCIHEGDQVQLRDLQMERPHDMLRGRFDPDMTKAIGEVGIVGRIDSDGDMHVFFPSIRKGWCIVPTALRKVKRPDIRATAIFEGDMVMITSDLERLKTVQQEKNHWEDGMEKSLGQIGRVRGVSKNGNIAVRVTGLGENWTFTCSPEVVQKTDIQGDMCDQGLHHLKRGVSKICMQCGECTAKGAECSMKDKPLRPPGSCCGCARKDVWCADCGVCRSCSGEKSEEERMLGRLKRPLQPLEDIIGEIVPDEEPNEHGLMVRDEVKVTVDSDTLKKVQEENGLHWDENMEKIIGLPGKIVALWKNIAIVLFENEERELLFSGCLTKISGGKQDEQKTFKKGDLVRLMNDEEKLRDLQKRHGGYVDTMQGCLGKTGCVKKIAKRRVQVEFLHTRLLWFNPGALTEVSSEAQQKTVHQFKRGDCVKVAVDPETFKANQVGHGGYGDEMLKMMETAAAVVHYVDLDGDVFVCLQNGKGYLIHPANLEKVSPEDFMSEDSSELKKGELVMVDADKVKIRHVQKATGNINWDNAFYAAAGKVGQVDDSIDSSDSTVVVNINKASFPLNSALVKRATLADMQEHFGRNLTSDFARGDQVRISVGLEELRNLQDGHGEYRADMEKVMTEAGSVCFIDTEGDIYVRFNLGRLCFNPAALSKVEVAEDRFSVGDLVHIESDLELFKSLQTKEHGGYVEQMVEARGKVGRLLSIINSSKIRVKVQGRAWVFNPQLLRRIGNPRAGTADWKSATICAPGKHDWSHGRCLLCVVCGECTEHGNLCHAPGRPHKTPGSVAGCGDGQAGCDDCGCCKTCAGEDVEDFLQTDEMKDVIMKTLKELVDRKLAVDETKTVCTKYRMSESAEVEMQRKKMLALLGDMSQTIELIKGSKDSGSIMEVMKAVAEHFCSPWAHRNREEKKQIGDHLANIGAVQVFMEYGSFLSSEAGQNDGAGGKLASECMSMLYDVVRNCADKSLELGHAVGRSGLLQMAMGELHRWYGTDESDIKHEWIQLLVSLLNNCAKVPENVDYFRDTGAVDLLKKHLDVADMALKVETLCCLASIVNTEELDLIQLGAEDAEFFVSTLNAAVDNASHVCQGYENTIWSAIELVKDLMILARHNGNKHAFVKIGALEALILLMESGNDMEKEYSMLCVQRFAMVDSIRETIVSETRVEAVLRALLTQQTEIYAVQAAARNTLKCLGKEPTSS